MSTTQAQEYGKKGELLVGQHLITQGFSIVAYNYRRFFGEIDIIGKKKDLLVFVEVKTRSNDCIDAAELINRRKQKKIGLVAQNFLATHQITTSNCRFDVALVYNINNHYTVQYIENAFTIIE